MDKLEALIYQAVGAASMCWIGGPQGDFDQKNAARIAEELFHAVKEHEAEAVLKAQSAWHLSHTKIIRDASGQEIARSKGIPIVGEPGPELMYLPQGANVYPTKQPDEKSR